MVEMEQNESGYCLTTHLPYKNCANSNHTALLSSSYNSPYHITQNKISSIDKNVSILNSLNKLQQYFYKPEPLSLSLLYFSSFYSLPLLHQSYVLLHFLLTWLQICLFG